MSVKDVAHGVRMLEAFVEQGEELEHDIAESARKNLVLWGGQCGKATSTKLFRLVPAFLGAAKATLKWHRLGRWENRLGNDNDFKEQTEGYVTAFAAEVEKGMREAGMEVPE